MKKYICILWLLAGVASCDVLEMTPLDKISEADTWTDQALIQTYVNGSYNAVQHGFGRAMISVASDDAYSIFNNAGFYFAQLGTLTSDNVTGMDARLNLWTYAYGYIRNINTFFEKIEEAPVDGDFKNAAIGEMKFIRAYVYAGLIWLYGGVPLITKTFQLNEDYAVTRSSYDECVNFIVAELDDAMLRLPARQPDSQKGRASGDACRALKARVLLYAASALNNPDGDRSKWQRAADAIEPLLNAGYELHGDYRSTFLTDNSEIIFARYFTSSVSHNFQYINGRSGSNGGGEGCPLHNLVNAYEMASTGLLPYSEEADGTLTLNTASGYDPDHPYDGRDPRFDATILHDGSMWQGRETETFHGGLDSPESSVAPWNASLTAYCYKKFIIEDVLVVGAAVNQTNPWIYFRYGEALLNYAEAKFELGDEEAAREYL
ncbi:MAG: RagB/SusD family nutrient uptake outer membrane protein, partial [Tannerella sp.]|nr:RagB/SusD family nutrient uptake outer membrane protein [Tannerella sp.]